jgi:hypothetical protein
MNHLSLNILYNSQFGFRKRTSTENAAYKLINDILTALNNRRTVGDVFFYLENACDCVNHDILLAELEFYRVKGVTCSLIKSYLENKCQMVKYNNKLSKWGKINIGVPQGSILGLLLFSIYIIYLPLIIQCLNPMNTPVVLFADTSINVNESDFINLERELNTDLSQ